MLSLLAAILNQKIMPKIPMYEYEPCTFDITPLLSTFEYAPCGFNISGDIPVCIVSGAGTADINGNYIPDPNHSNKPKHQTLNYWIVFGMDFYSPGDAYVISNDPNYPVGGGTAYYFWNTNWGYNPGWVSIGQGASPVPNIVGT